MNPKLERCGDSHHHLSRRQRSDGVCLLVCQNFLFWPKQTRHAAKCFYLRTSAFLALVLSGQKIFEKVTEELQGAILERVAGSVEELEEVEVVLKLDQRCDVLGAECRVTSLDDSLQVVGGDFAAGDVEAEDLESELGVGEILPAFLESIVSHWSLRNESRAIQSH